MLLCPVPHCGKRMRRPRSGLCPRCRRLWNRCYVPHAGFIPVNTVRKIAKSILKTHSPSQSDVVMALRIARGTRHRAGPWEDRPPYRLTPLMTGTAYKRRPQLLVGKRTEPKIEACVKALVQEVLLEEYLETGTLYAHALSGQTYFGTRGLYAPKGGKPDQGPYKHSIYRMNNRDFGIIATAAIKACRRAGLEIKDRDLRAQIVTMYHTGMEAGNYQEPIYPPRDAMRTTQVGDHPLDFRMPRRPWAPAHLKGKIVRAGGTCEGQPVKLVQMLPKPQYRSAIHKVEPKVFKAQPRREAPSTDWIFEQT